ncbi:hypothetical protein FQZ97_583060 [compost metagenome]
MTFEPSETLRDPFVLYGESFGSRLLLGTARYPAAARSTRTRCACCASACRIRR